jgi:hypothetical protein
LSKRSVRIGSRCNPRAIRPVASKAGWDALTCDSRVLLALRHNAHSPNGHLAAPAPRVPNLGRGAWEGPRTWTRAPEHAHAVGTAVGTGLPPPLEVFCAGGKILLFGEADDDSNPRPSAWEAARAAERPKPAEDKKRRKPAWLLGLRQRGCENMRKRDLAESKRDGVEMASGSPDWQRASYTRKPWRPRS